MAAMIVRELRQGDTKTKNTPARHTTHRNMAKEDGRREAGERREGGGREAGEGGSERLCLVYTAERSGIMAIHDHGRTCFFPRRMHRGEGGETAV